MKENQNIITILGCSGFIGSHLLERILNTTKAFVYGIDLNSRKVQPFISNNRFEFLKTDISDIKSIKPVLQKSSIVVSLTALCNPSLYNTVTLKVIESNYNKPVEIVKMCCEYGCRFIHFSTCEVYGRTVESYCKESVLESVLKEDETPFVTGPVHLQRWSYSSAKQLLERAIYAYGVEHGLKCSIVRPFNFIGPRMDFIPGIDGEGIPRVLACFMDALIFNKPLFLVDGGKNRRCFTYIDDAVDAIMAIIENEKIADKQIFNIGNPDNEITIEQLAYKMIGLYKELQPQKISSLYDVKTISSLRFYGEGYQDCDRRVPDISKAQSLLGWVPHTDLDIALKKTISAYIEQYSG